MFIVYLVRFRLLSDHLFAKKLLTRLTISLATLCFGYLLLYLFPVLALGLIASIPDILSVQASRHLLWLYSPVSVGPGSETEDRFSNVAASVKCAGFCSCSGRKRHNLYRLCIDDGFLSKSICSNQMHYCCN